MFLSPCELKAFVLCSQASVNIALSLATLLNHTSALPQCSPAACHKKKQKTCGVVVDLSLTLNIFSMHRYYRKKKKNSKIDLKNIHFATMSLWSSSPGKSAGSQRYVFRPWQWQYDLIKKVNLWTFNFITVYGMEHAKWGKPWTHGYDGKNTQRHRYQQQGNKWTIIHITSCLNTNWYKWLYPLCHKQVTCSLIQWNISFCRQ